MTPRSAKILRMLMMASAVSLAFSTAMWFRDAGVACYPMATALFFWALRGPGHVTATDQ